MSRLDAFRPSRGWPATTRGGCVVYTRAAATRQTVAGDPAPSAPVFVLVHGIGMSHRYFDRLSVELARHGAVYTIDLPGFGGTPKPSRQQSVEDYAERLAATLRDLEVASCVLVGHSMGAQFVTELAARHPELVSRVVLMGPVVQPERGTLTQQALALLVDTTRESVSTNTIVLADYLRTGPRWYLTEVPAMFEYPILSRVADIASPVLVLRGSRDPIATLKWCAELAATARTGELLEVAGQPHVAHRGAAGEVAAAIVAFAANGQRSPVPPTRPSTSAP